MKRIETFSPIHFFQKFLELLSFLISLLASLLLLILIGKTIIAILCPKKIYCITILSEFTICAKENYLTVVITTCATIIVAVFKVLNNNDTTRKQNALNYITKNRTEWMENVRNITAQLTKAVYICLEEDYRFIDIHPERFAELNEKYAICQNNINQLLVRYNPAGERDKVIIKIITIIQTYLNAYKSLMTQPVKLSTTLAKADELKKNIIEAVKLLVVHTQIYIKEEWDGLKTKLCMTVTCLAEENGSENKCT